MKLEYFKPSEGWIMDSFTVRLPVKKKMVTFVRPYLFNEITLDLITVQPRAWNDTVGCLMWIKIQLKAFKVIF